MPSIKLLSFFNNHSKVKYLALLAVIIYGIISLNNNFTVTKEEFYTLFQPYYLERKYAKVANTVSLSNTTTDLLHYRTKPILFGTSSNENSYELSKLLSSLIITSSSSTLFL